MAPDGETVDDLRGKAAQCRRLAASIGNQTDRAVTALLALAAEFEERAKALERITEEAVEPEADSDYGRRR